MGKTERSKILGVRRVEIKSLFRVGYIKPEMAAECPCGEAMEP